MKFSYIRPSKLYLDHYESFINNEFIPNYKNNRETILNSDISTRPSLSLNHKTQNRKKIPCFCNCHLNNYKYNPYHLINTSSFPNKNKKIYESHNYLVSKMNNLKENLKEFENKLNKTKIEKNAADFYIKKLEKELSYNNINNS